MVGVDFSENIFDEHDFTKEEVQTNASVLYTAIRSYIDEDIYWYVHEIEADIVIPYSEPEEATHKQEITCNGSWSSTTFYNAKGERIGSYDDLTSLETSMETPDDEMEEI